MPRRTVRPIRTIEDIVDSLVKNLGEYTTQRGAKEAIDDEIDFILPSEIYHDMDAAISLFSSDENCYYVSLKDAAAEINRRSTNDSNVYGAMIAAILLTIKFHLKSRWHEVIGEIDLNHGSGLPYFK